VTAPLKVFLSFAHEDESHRETLDKHLSALVREGLIEIWHDRQITGGREWAGAIDQALKGSDIVLLLISADFLDSDYCNDVELTEAIRMHDAKQARVVPVILRSCDWEKSQFARFNALPADGKPVVEAEHPDQCFKAVAKGLRAIVGELRGETDGISARLPSQAEPASQPQPFVTDIGKVPKTAEPQSESQGAAAETVSATKAAGTEPAATPKPRHFTIGKISLLGMVEIGPFEIRLPTPVTALFGVIALALLVGIVGFFTVQGPRADAREAMRMARYDVALTRLADVPGWLDWWPTVVTMRKLARLGAGFQKSGQDWETLAEELRRQRAAAPADADLMVLEATYWLRREDYNKARELVAAALKEDDQNAEAWFLRGLDRDLARDVSNAALDYRRAVDLAPDSPQYRGNLARALLETGKVDESIQEYRKISQFPLARVEQALGHWSRGETGEAAGAQGDAIKMLDDAKLMDSFYNRRGWMFLLSHKGVRLTSLQDKRCFASLGESASRRLAGESASAFPPAACSDPPLEIRELLADDLCRFVDARQPKRAAAAGELRGALGQPEICPTPVQPESAPPAKTS
jgi:tetratricopeptide (TPR) repeat protein